MSTGARRQCQAGKSADGNGGAWNVKTVIPENWAISGEAMKRQLITSMNIADKQEEEMAIAENHYHQGVPYVSVVADGGWSKHNAMSRVAVIFGLKSKRLLFLGVRNKYCSVWSVAEHKGQTYTRTQIAIIIGVAHPVPWRVMWWQRVSDGRKRPMRWWSPPLIQQSVPYGSYVENIECAICAVKLYRSRLEQLVKDHLQFRGKGHLTNEVIRWLTVSAHVAIRLHSQDGNVQQLCHDLRNWSAHVFGDHIVSVVPSSASLVM